MSEEREPVTEKELYISKMYEKWDKVRVREYYEKANAFWKVISSNLVILLLFVLLCFFLFCVVVSVIEKFDRQIIKLIVSFAVLSVALYMVF